VSLSPFCMQRGRRVQPSLLPWPLSRKQDVGGTLLARENTVNLSLVRMRRNRHMYFLYFPSPLSCP
jgi:hypothetical protein